MINITKRDARELANHIGSAATWRICVEAELSKPMAFRTPGRTKQLMQWFNDDAAIVNEMLGQDALVLFDISGLA